MAAVYKRAGRPLPRFSDDDVLDYMVTEAVVAKSVKEQNEQIREREANQKKETWKSDFRSLEEGLMASPAASTTIQQ